MNKENLNTNDVYRFHMTSGYDPSITYDFYCKFTGSEVLGNIETLLNFKIIIKNKASKWTQDEFNLYPSQLIYLTKIEFDEQ